MELSLFYFVFTFFILLSTADPAAFNNQCPTSRRLLFFGGLMSPAEDKKSVKTSSSSRLPASPPKYARSPDLHGLVVFIRPQTSTERGRKSRSYAHLLKPKLFPAKDKTKSKHSKKLSKKKNSTDSFISHTKELIPLNDEDLSRCRALLQIDSIKPDLPKVKKVKAVASKVKNAIPQVTKALKNKVTDAPVIRSENEKKTKTTSKNNPNEKKTSKITERQSPETPIKTSSSSQSTTNTKPRREKPSSPPPAIPIIEEAMEFFDANEDEYYNKNNSVVNRAIHFVKNMFQLSDDLLNDNRADDEHFIDLTTESPPPPQQQQQQQHHHSRKLLMIDEMPIITYNNIDDYNCDLEQSIKTSADDLSYLATSVSKRQLLSVKTNKHAAPAAAAPSKTSHTKEKKPKSLFSADAKKPKVGWAYRYRISRFLNAQKMKRTGKKTKVPNGGKTKHSKDTHEKSSASSNTKVSKRKLLAYDDHDRSNCERSKISDPDIINSVSNTEHCIPKRQLLASKRKDDTDDDDIERQKVNARRRMKSLDELTDPVAIVLSYEKGLHKPRVGWQFRYRVSRYIDSLRENIRDDQERLTLGLQAIKRKTPQELSGRRKRVSDKPIAADADELKKQEKARMTKEENKPKVGWRYRYRVSKMRVAKKRGDFIDDEEEKRRARREQKKKPSNLNNASTEKDLDPELMKINNQGRRVGWTYRYRIRRKLDHLKQEQAETGIPFDLATLNGKRDKKISGAKIKSTEKKTNEPVQEKPIEKPKSVGWDYRYRVSKMHDAQKTGKSKVSTNKKPERIPVGEELDPELAGLSRDQRVAGWKYRYRIRRKLDDMKDGPSTEDQTGKRTKKSSSSKPKNRKKLLDKVEESIEKMLNINDMEETPFMQYLHRTSTHIFSGLVPMAKKSICLLPLPMKFPFCNEDNDDQITISTTKPKQKRRKKLKTKKEPRAKQFIRPRVTKLGADDKVTERRVDEVMKKLYKKPSLPPPQTPPPPPPPSNSGRIPKTDYLLPKRAELHGRHRRSNDEEQGIKRKVGVDSKKTQNKKQFQIIGQEVKVKNKHPSPSPVTTPSPPVVETSTTTPSPPRLRSLSEVIQEEASNILTVKRSSSKTPDEIKADIDEANEIVQERTELKETTTSTLAAAIDRTTSEEDDSDSAATDDDSKIVQENVKQNAHNKHALENEQNSA